MKEIFSFLWLLTAFSIQTVYCLQVEQHEILELAWKYKTAGNPYADVSLSAEFANKNRTFFVEGFYDGDDTYRLRFMPDEVGQWRYVIVTDMTHDDGNSLIRLLYYANEIDIEAIVIAPQRPDYPWDSDMPWQKEQRILEAYGKVYERLKQHDSRYPEPEVLKKITRRGHGGLPIMWHSKGEAVNDWIGESQSLGR